MAALAPAADWQPDTATALERLRGSREARIARTKKRRWAGAMTAVLCVSALAFPGTRVFAKRCVNACLTGNFTAPVEGLAPDFTLTDASGKTVRLSDFRSKVVLVNFWATWCVPCKTEIPWFSEFQESYGKDGLVVLGISLDEDGWKAVKPYISTKNVAYRIMLGNAEVAKSYGGVDAIPETFLIDREGRIATGHRGLVEKQVYEEEIGKLIGEKP